MSAPLLALHWPDPDWSGLHLIAATRNPAAIRAFWQAVLKDARERVSGTRTAKARRLALLKLAELEARLALVGGAS